jgi:hypothetical protein
MLATIQSKNFCHFVCCLKKVRITICKTIILPAVLYVCETRSLTLREENELRVLENRVLRIMNGLKGQEFGENCLTKSPITCTLRQV